MKNIWKIWIVGLCLVITGGGCVSIEITPEEVVPKAEPTTWEPVGDGAARMLYRFGEEAYDRLVIYRFNQNRFSFSILHDDTPKPVSQWHTQHDDAVFVFNGAYFHADNMPSGWVVSNEERIGDRRFDLDKSAVISLAPHVTIVDTALEAVDFDTQQHALQSYPLLVSDSAVAIKNDSGYAARRTFLGTDRDGRVYVGFIPSTRVSLYRLAHLLTELPIDWRNAINLDGGTSTGFSARLATKNETVDSLVPVPSVIVIKTRME